MSIYKANQFDFEASIRHADTALANISDVGGRLRASILKRRSNSYYEYALITAEENGAFSYSLALLDSAYADNPLNEAAVNLRRGTIHARKYDFANAIEYTKLAYRATNQDWINIRSALNLARYNAIMNRKEQALGWLYDLYDYPDLYNEARWEARNDGDFYNIYRDTRFQAWLDGNTRLRIDNFAVDLISCEDEFRELLYFTTIVSHSGTHQ